MDQVIVIPSQLEIMRQIDSRRAEIAQLKRLLTMSAAAARAEAARQRVAAVDRVTCARDREGRR
jgi:hypothetical protein